MARSAFSVVIPCYNEEGAIVETLNQLRECLGDCHSYEIIVVDDGSADDTPVLLADYAKGAPEVHVVKHAKNRGYGAALKTGINRAEHELIVIVDADGTYPLNRLLDLVDEAEHADMVVGSRTGENVTYPLIRRIPKAFLRGYSSWLVGREIPDMNSGMRVFRKSLAKRFFKILPNTFSFTTTITLCMMTNSCDVRYVPIDYAARVGKSKIRPIRDTLRFCQLIVRTGMYFAPLRVLMPVSVLMLLGFAVSFVSDVLNHNLTDKTVILLMFGLNTTMFGLLADMIDKRSAS